jgi:hypothetical protein
MRFAAPSEVNPFADLVIFVVNPIVVWQPGAEQCHSTTKNTNFTKKSDESGKPGRGFSLG